MPYAIRIGRALLSLCDFGYYQRKGTCVMSHHRESVTQTDPCKGMAVLHPKRRYSTSAVLAPLATMACYSQGHGQFDQLDPKRV